MDKSVCCICGDSPAAIEPRFGYSICKAHESIPPSKVARLVHDESDNVWVHDGDNQCLYLPWKAVDSTVGHDEEIYYVDYDRCTSEGDVRDWVRQVDEKTWATPKIVRDLRVALEGRIGGS